MMLLILLLAAVVLVTIATVVELRRDGFHRLPNRRFGTTGTQDTDDFGRSLTAGLR